MPRFYCPSPLRTGSVLDLPGGINEQVDALFAPVGMSGHPMPGLCVIEHGSLMLFVGFRGVFLGDERAE